MEFDFNVQLQQMNLEEANMKETIKEDRKDQRTKMQATQQSQLISQRQNDSLPTNFEETQNNADVDMENFNPPA